MIKKQEKPKTGKKLDMDWVKVVNNKNLSKERKMEKVITVVQKIE